MGQDKIGVTDSSNKGSVSAWIAGIASLLTVAMTVFNSITASHIEEQKLKLESEQNRLDQIRVDISRLEVQSQIALEEARENFARYEFVHKLMPSLLSERKEQRMFSRNLIIVALHEDEAQKIFEGFSLSDDPVAKKEGASGLDELRMRRDERRSRIEKLSKELNHFERTVRNAALTNLISEYSKDTSTVHNVLNWLNEDAVNELSIQGRVNVLYVLEATHVSAWTPELIESAERGLERLKALSLGPQAKGYLDKLEKHVKKIEPQIKN